MKKKILLAPNSFKESADSLIVSNVIANQLKALDDYLVIERPISDGGDGFLSVCEKLFNGIRLTYSIKNVYSDKISPVEVVYVESDSTVYIESAEVIGLKKVPREYRNPMLLNTSPLGELLNKLIKDVLENRISIAKVVIGVGGTATVDFGLGTASRFGVKVFDANGLNLDVNPINFKNIKTVQFEKITLPFKIEVIADVSTFLFGENNAIKMYSEQKGADKDQIKDLMKGFDNLYNLYENNDLIKLTKPINGSGGGLAAGLQIFFNAGMVTSSDFINNQLFNDINEYEIDAVITGEGAFDKQSLEDKGAFIVTQIYKNLNVPVFLICGSVEKSILSILPKNIKVIELSNYFDSVEKSIKNFESGLKKAANEIIACLKN